MVGSAWLHGDGGKACRDFFFFLSRECGVCAKYTVPRQYSRTYSVSAGGMLVCESRLAVLGINDAHGVKSGMQAELVASTRKQHAIRVEKPEPVGTVGTMDGSSKVPPTVGAMAGGQC